MLSNSDTSVYFFMSFRIFLAGLLFLTEFESSVAAPGSINVSPPYLGCEKILTRVISFIDKLKSSLVRPDLAVYGIRIG